MTSMNHIMESLLALDQNGLMQHVDDALKKDIPAGAILKDGLIAGMDIVGQRMESGEMYIPEVLMAAKIMAEALEKLTPLLGEDEVAGAGKVVIGTVKGDLHDIGKNLVTMMLESAGFKVMDLGIDVDPDVFISSIQENSPDLVCFSALLTTTMPMMKTTIEALSQAGVRDSVKIVIGGAPVTQKFADEIGADGYAVDAGAATKLAKALMQQ